MSRKRTILCVDDDPNVLSTMKLVLATADYEVLTAADVPEAVRLLTSHRIDVILVDSLPNRGWLVLEAKRANPAVRVLIHTGRDLGEPGANGISDVPGVDGILLKPVPPLELLRKMSELLPR